MACTATIIDGPGVVAGLGLISTWKVLMDTSSLVTGEPIDLTSVYSSISWCGEGGSDAVADNAYTYSTVLPSDGTDITSTTVLISVYMSAAETAATHAATAFTAANAVDLSGVGELRLMSIGKAIT
jgi:hypothetical protein